MQPLLNFVRTLLLSLVFLGAMARAKPPQPLAARAAQPENAQSVARAIQAHYRGAVTLEAVFLETYRAGKNDLRVESGTVYFRRPGQMRWDYQSPQKKLFLVDGHTAWFYIPASHAASRAPVRQSDDWRTPFSLLTGKARLGDLCKQVSIVANPGGPAAPPPDHVVLDCEPKHKGAFLGAQIEVDGEDRIVSVVVDQPGDVSMEVRFGNWRENVALPESLFRFQAPPGVSVVNQQAMTGAM